MNIGMYCRVSSPLAKDEDTDDYKQKQKQDVDNQVYALRSFINNRWNLDNLVEKIVISYLEYASSVKHRPIFNQMMEDARLGKLQIIVVWKIDRFARSMNDFCYWTQQLSKWGVRFIATQDNIDTDITTASGQLMMNILGAFAQFERQIIVERINASIAMRRAKGLPIGRTKVIARIDEMFRLHKEEKMSIRKIAERMGLAKSLVERRLKAYAKLQPVGNIHDSEVYEIPISEEDIL